jgi:hypothetical protein
MTWIEDAPKFTGNAVAGVIIESPEGAVLPAVAFLFADSEGKEVTAMLVGNETTLKKFRNSVVKSIGLAEKQAKQRRRELVRLQRVEAEEEARLSEVEIHEADRTQTDFPHSDL